MFLKYRAVNIYIGILHNHCNYVQLQIIINIYSMQYRTNINVFL